jgi:hypothetical protein
MSIDYFPFRCFTVKNAFVYDEIEGIRRDPVVPDDITIGRTYKGAKSNGQFIKEQNADCIRIYTVSSLRRIAAANDCDCTCDTAFMFGSIYGGQNVRIDQSTDKDPSIFIDAKYFDFKDFTWYSKAISGDYTHSTIDQNSMLAYTLTSSGTNTFGDKSYAFKEINNDGVPTSSITSVTATSGGQIIIEANDDSWYIGLDGRRYYKEDTVVGAYTTDYRKSNCDSIIISTHKFKVDSTSVPYNRHVYSHSVTDAYNNEVFYFRPLIEGSCVKFEETDDHIKLLFDPTCYRITKPCCS